MIVILISDMLFDTPTTKVEKYRFTTPLGFLAEKTIKEYETKTEPEYWRWFDTIEQAEQYLKN